MTETAGTGVRIPYERLNAETLRGIIEDFVTRDGTDYGHGSFTLEEKVEQVMLQLRRGKAEIVFDEATETCTIVRR